MALSCERCVDLFGEYAERALSPEAVDEMTVHLRACPACVEALAQYERVPGLIRRATDVPMPRDVRARLRRALGLVWRRRPH